MYTVNEIKELMDMGFTHEQIVAMNNDNKKSSKPTGATGMSKAEKWEHKKAEKQAERRRKILYRKAHAGDIRAIQKRYKNYRSYQRNVAKRQNRFL